jgi:hypothetical protein
MKTFNWKATANAIFINDITISLGIIFLAVIIAAVIIALTISGFIADCFQAVWSIGKRIKFRKHLVFLIKNGQTDSQLCRAAYDPDTKLFSNNLAYNVLEQILKTWQQQEDSNGESSDKISAFAKSWVNYLAVYVNNDSLLVYLTFAIRVLIAKRILPPQYSLLEFNLSNRFNENIQYRLEIIIKLMQREETIKEDSIKEGRVAKAQPENIQPD